MRSEVWNSMLDADMNARYWGLLARRYSHRELGVKLFLALTASSTVAAWQFWSQLTVLWKLMSGLAALAAIVLPILNYPRLIRKTSDLAGRWLQVQADYEILWATIDNTSVHQLSKRFSDLKRREAHVKRDEQTLPERQALLRACQKAIIQSRRLPRAST